MHGEVCHTNKAMPPQPSSIIVTRFGHQGVLPGHDKQHQPILCVWESGYKQINACSLKRFGICVHNHGVKTWVFNIALPMVC